MYVYDCMCMYKENSDWTQFSKTVFGSHENCFELFDEAY